MINENVEADVMKRLNENKLVATTQELKEHTGHVGGGNSQGSRSVPERRPASRGPPEGVWTLAREQGLLTYNKLLHYGCCRAE
jgi:hypothetical protein